MAKSRVLSVEVRAAVSDRAYLVFLMWQCLGFIRALRRATAEVEATRRYADAWSRNFAEQQQAFSTTVS